MGVARSDTPRKILKSTPYGNIKMIELEKNGPKMEKLLATHARDNHQSPNCLTIANRARGDKKMQGINAVAVTVRCV